ncbi:hypothetical protein [Streptomyces sp. NPDC021969]|uniref:hypothetical protein n=1 Tax=unclassified Streptomyces TaxID=2593676 RepID=UPI0033F695CE
MRTVLRSMSRPLAPRTGRVVPDGGLHAAGSTRDVMTEDTVRSVYGMESRVIEDPVSGNPLVLPIGRHHTTATATAAADGDGGARS